jgi:DNA-directed RNA polymerase subunit beta'
VEDLSANKEITSSNIFYRRSKSFDEDGLFSERIFGPTKNYKCKCGKLNSEILDSNKRCDKCKVLCTDSDSRFNNYGIITLPFPCIKPLKIEKDLKHVVKNVLEYKNSLFDPSKNDYNITHSRYLGIHKHKATLKLFDNRNSKDYIYIPLRITGIYSFSLCLKYIANNFIGFENVEDLFKNQVIMSYLKVIPPGIRPVSFENVNSNKIRLTDVNTAYISVLNLNKSNRALKDNLIIDEDDWYERISCYFAQDDFENSDEEIVEHAIIEYDTIAARYQYYINQIYESLMDTISGKTGFIRHNMLGKTIEFSARSVVICDPSLEPYQIKVAKKILYKLWMLYFLHWLITIKKVNIIWCFENVTIKEYDENKELFDEFLEWMGDHD